jgi:dihydrofolate reductase
MGTIVISENVSLDGVMQDPTGEEGTANGGWFNDLSDSDREQWAKIGYREAVAARALLMGRGSYEYFVRRGWQQREGDWADRLRAVPKYVVSATLRDLEWSNTTVVSGDPAAVAARLRWEVDGEIVVNASGRLAPTLWEAGVVDELRLMVFPAVVGGPSVFAGVPGGQRLRLADNRRVGDSLTFLRYEVARG